MALRRRRLAHRAETPEAMQPPSRAESVRAVTSSQAMTLSSVYRGIDILAVAVSQLNIGVWRRGEEIDTPSVIAKPDLYTHRAAFLEETTTSLATTGNAFWRKHSTGPGEPVINLELIPPHEIAVTKPGPYPEYSWKSQPLKAWQVTHLKKMRLPGRTYGLGPIEAAAAELRGALDLQGYASEWFDRSGIPNGVLTTDQSLNATQAEAWKERAKTLFKPGDPAVLGNGLKYEPVALRPADAQFLESRQFSVTEVARMLGLPASYLLTAVQGTSDTYSNQEQVDIWFVRYTLMSYLREIEMAFTDLLPRGQEARFKVDALLRTDTKTRYEAHQIAITSGLYTVAHAQQIEGLPITGATAPVTESENADA